MALFSILSKLGLSKLWLNSSPAVYVLYFFIYILNTKDTVLSSTSPSVCEMDQSRTCHCINNNTKAVHCLLGNLKNSACERNATKSYKLFCEVMSQFDCRTKYSVKWNCTDCLDAYTKWLLAVFNPENDAWLLNCAEIDTNSTNIDKMSLCRDVLAKCPYFAPQNSYGDAPAFDCPLKRKFKYDDKWNCRRNNSDSSNN
ncbi:Hypothetical predicted protein [Paramuricea clavata]|uniref:Uncharacterized protein n=2 Tax=Paramuricea clavata TaxID=317549 RepID=A0A6S7HPD9_PARCT|nr:Hypothetical predicted protein [Paramuricea clavata]